MLSQTQSTETRSTASVNKTASADSQAEQAQITQAMRDTFARQRANRWKVATSTAEDRIAKLKRFRTAILRRQNELKAALHADFRKPEAEVELTELQPVLAEIAHTISHLKDWMQPVRVKTPTTLLSTKSYVRYEAKGVVLILSPWNYPFNLLMSPLIGAIAAGNCVMMRPSDKVRKTSEFMKSLIQEVFGEDEVAIFTGPSWIANTLLELPFDHVLFTGSTQIGKQIMASAAQNLASVTLELGGQSPVIVDETADVKKAAERVVWGKFLNAGQTCVAPNHVWVHETKKEAFVAEAKRLIEARYGKTDADRHESRDFARIVDTRSHKRLVGMIENSVRTGAILVTGGHAVENERYLAPTLLSDVTPNSAVMSEEIFGTILPVLTYNNIEDVFQDIYSRGKPLALYAFSESRGNLERILKHTTSGGTVINNVVIHLGNPDLPFGGIGESGTGNYHGIYGFRTFSHERAVLEQGPVSTVAWFYPPYTPKILKRLEWVTKYLAM